MQKTTLWFRVAGWQKKLASTLTIAALVVLSAGPLLVPNVASATNDPKVKICHATSSQSNPWNAIEVNQNAQATHLGHGDFLYTGSGLSDEWCEENAPAPVVVENSCPLPSALSDVTKETLGASPSGEETLQQILNGESYGLNVAIDQKQYQVWNVTSGSEVIIDPVKFIDEFAGREQVFGYYTNGNISSFVPIFKTASVAGYDTVPLYNTGPFDVTVPVGATTLGFAIRSFANTSDGTPNTFATENNLNTASKDHVVVYNPATNKYVLAFEDLTAVQNSDNDHNDLVVEVTLACQPTTGTLVVKKVIIGNPQAAFTTFQYKVDSNLPQYFDSDGEISEIVSVGAHTVIEDLIPANYAVAYSNSLNANQSCSNLNVAPGATVTCTITNTYIDPGPQCDLNASHEVVSDFTTVASTSVAIGPAVTAPFPYHSAWTAVIPGATWIWGESPMFDTENDVTETFTKTFTVTGTPLGGTLEIATDNSYEVTLNGDPLCSDATENNFASVDSCAVAAGDLQTVLTYSSLLLRTGHRQMVQKHQTQQV